MSKTKKKILFYSLFAAFFLVGYFALLFAFGYTYDFDSNKFVKTGSIYVSATSPVTVKIGDEKPKNTGGLLNNNVSKKYLLPGQYGIEVSKQGYYTWYKEVDVPAGLVASFQNIVMIPNDLAPTTLLPTVRNLFVSDNGEFIFYRDLSNRYGLIDLDDPVIEPSDTRLTTGLNIFSWDEDNKNIFFSNFATSKIVGNTERIVPTPTSLLNSTLTLVDEFLISLSGNQILIYDHEQGSFVDTISNASSFAVNGGRNIYYISTDDNLLYKYDLNNNSNVLVSGADNFSGGRILKAEVINNELYVLIRGGSNNFLFRVSTENIDLIASYIIDFSVSYDKEKIAYWNNAEVWVYYLKDTNIQPFQEAGDIERVLTGNGIINVDWHKYNGGLIVFTDRAVIFTETDTRSYTNAITLFDVIRDTEGPIQAIRNGVYNASSDNIYFQLGTELRRISLED